MAGGLSETDATKLAADRIRASVAVKERLLEPEALAEIAAASAAIGRTLSEGG
ncbi:MAG: hypothetical protein QOI89_749, partial [Solirubrobacteraceae bacterium]|nr:hypothetical protein [Solirubrobacteraceae bacterium]